MNFGNLPLIAALALLFASCAPYDGDSTATTSAWSRSQSFSTSSIPVSAPAMTVGGLLKQVNLKVDMVKKGTYGRKVVRPMKPRYITIHSTQNYQADAYRHSLALKRGALRAPKRKGGNRIGFLIWHFTVDQKVAIQHMPVNEQGEHADFDGPGNNYSIGIEMCEQRGSNLSAAIDRTAKLTAILMLKNGIPLRNVVPHYHWPRRGMHPPNKNCPHFLMDNGRPGRRWQWFLAKVNYYYRGLQQSQNYAQR
jgi:N-acetylmuramoyl-L-alanine amidase